MNIKNDINNVKDNVTVFLKSKEMRTLFKQHNMPTNGLPGAIAASLGGDLKIDGMYFGFTNSGAAPYEAHAGNDAAYYATHLTNRSFVRVPLIGKPTLQDDGNGVFTGNVLTMTAVASNEAFHTGESVRDGLSVFNHAALIARGKDQSSDIICAAFDFQTPITKAAGVACGVLWSLTFGI
jgi:hypothetical protein